MKLWLLCMPTLLLCYTSIVHRTLCNTFSFSITNQSITQFTTQKHNTFIHPFTNYAPKTPTNTKVNIKKPAKVVAHMHLPQPPNAIKSPTNYKASDIRVGSPPSMHLPSSPLAAVSLSLSIRKLHALHAVLSHRQSLCNPRTAGGPLRDARLASCRETLESCKLHAYLP